MVEQIDGGTYAFGTIDILAGLETKARQVIAAGQNVASREVRASFQEAEKRPKLRQELVARLAGEERKLLNAIASLQLPALQQRKQFNENKSQCKIIMTEELLMKLLSMKNTCTRGPHWGRTRILLCFLYK